MFDAGDPGDGGFDPARDLPFKIRRSRTQLHGRDTDDRDHDRRHTLNRQLHPAGHSQHQQQREQN